MTSVAIKCGLKKTAFGDLIKACSLPNQYGRTRTKERLAFSPMAFLFLGDTNITSTFIHSRIALKSRLQTIRFKNAKEYHELFQVLTTPEF